MHATSTEHQRTTDKANERQAKGQPDEIAEQELRLVAGKGPAGPVPITANYTVGSSGLAAVNKQPV